MRTSAQIQTAIEILDDVDRLKRPADRLMSNYFRSNRYIGSKDKRAIGEWVYAIFRQKGSLQWLAESIGLPLESRSYLLIHISQTDSELLEEFDGEEYSPAQVSQPEAVALDKLNDVSIDDAPDYARLNVPEWLFPHLENSLDGSSNVEAEMTAMQQRASLDLRVNTLKSKKDSVQKQLSSEGYEVDECAYSPWALTLGSEQRVAINQLASFKEGLFEVQDQGSQLIALATQVEAGQKAVDFCAGAGGKTLAMAAMMQNKGVIHACDVHTRRMKNLSVRQKRAGAHNIQSHVLSSENDKWVKRQQKKMDVVLVDAPCTGTGTWRRSPDARWNLNAEQLENLVALQGSILTSACRMVKPGGRLVYATCSILKDENENQVAEFLKKNEDFVQGELPEFAGKDKLNVTDNYQLRTSTAKDGMDGFFVAVLQRKAAAE